MPKLSIRRSSPDVPAFSKIFPEWRLDLKNRNSRAERADIRDAFGSEEVEKVLEIYAKDFEYFGYDTDPALMTKAPTKP